MLTPQEHAIADPATSKAIGLDAKEHGLLLCTDERGERWTVIGDAEYVRTLADAPQHVLADLNLPAGLFPVKRQGWPDDWQ